MQTLDRNQLIEQLSELLSDETVIQQLPKNIKQQAMRILNKSATKYSKNRVKERSCNRQDLSRSHSRQKYESTYKSNKSLTKSSKNSQLSTKAYETLNQHRSPLGNIAQNSPFQRQCHSIRRIAEKQAELEAQKVYLEQRVMELKHLIAQEKKTLERHQIENERTHIETKGIIKSSRQTINKIAQKKKKNHDAGIQQRLLTEEIQSINEQEARVDKVLTEEKDLIEMYRVVISQLKAQLKNETRVRNQLKENLMSSVNVLKKTKQKFEILSRKTRGLVGAVDTNIRQFYS